MATGYANRETTRKTFAFAPQAGRQVQTAVSPTSGRQGVVGAGEATSGVVRSQNPTLDISVGSSIPSFLEATLEPVIKAQQEKRAYEGYALAADGIALSEIAKNQPGLTTIFGPTDFQRGAQLYASNEAVSKWRTEQLSNMDELKQVPPEQLGSLIYDTVAAHLTGDPFADNMIQQGIMEATATLIPAVTTARVEWQQNTLRRGFVSSAVAAGRAYAATVSTPNLDPAVRDNAGTSLLNNLIPPDGMTNEAWQSGVEETARGLLADGNLLAFSRLYEGGPDSPLYHAMDADKYATLMTAADTASKKVNADWAMANGPLLDSVLERIRTRSTTDAAGNTVPLSPAEFRTMLVALNEKAAAETGSLVPLRSADDIERLVDSGVQDVIAEDRREAQRNYEYSISSANPVVQAAAADAKLQDIRAGLTSGVPTTAIATYGKADVDSVLSASLNTDPVNTINTAIRIHKNTGVTFEATASAIQSQVTANVTAGAASTSFQRSLTMWKQFDADKPARAAYFGAYDTTFMRYEQLVAGGTEGVFAFSQTFGQPGAIAGTQARGRAAGGEDATKIDEALNKLTPRLLGFQVGPSGPSEESRRVIREVADTGILARKASGMSIEDATNAELSSLVASRKLDRVGSQYWHTPLGTPRMTDITGIPEDRLTQVWDQVIRQEFANRPGLSPNNYRVTPAVGGQVGNSVWYVSTEDNEGITRSFAVYPGTLSAYDRRIVEERRARVLPPVTNVFTGG